MTYEEIKNLAFKQKKENETHIKEYLETLVALPKNLTIDVSVGDVDNLLTRLSIVDNDKKLFGSELTFSYGSKLNLNTYKFSKRKLRLNSGSVGMVSKDENLGKYYMNVLKGQMCIHESEFCKMLESLDWSWSFRGGLRYYGSGRR